MADGVSVDINDEVDPDDRESQEDLLAGKYETPEDLEKGYLEAQRKIAELTQSGGDEGGNEGGDEDGDEEFDATITPQDPEELSLDDVVEEYAENGEIAEETYEALAERGMPRQHVEAFLRGQQALGEQIVDELASVVGGRGEFKKILKWAGNNLSREEVEAWNEAYQGGNVVAAKLLLQGMQSKRVNQVGNDPNLIGGETTPDLSGVKPFRSEDQLVEAMGDERYETDPDYRQEVDNRVAVSDIF